MRPTAARSPPALRAGNAGLILALLPLPAATRVVVVVTVDGVTMVVVDGCRVVVVVDDVAGALRRGRVVVVVRAVVVVDG